MSAAATKLLQDISRSINAACLTGALNAALVGDRFIRLSHGRDEVELDLGGLLANDLGMVQAALAHMEVPERAAEDFIKAFARQRGIPIRIERDAPAGEIAKGWSSYLVTVMAPDAPPIQVRETKRAFYAGAQHFLMSVMRIMDPEAEPTDADMARLEAMDQELQAFAREVAAGRA